MKGDANRHTPLGVLGRRTTIHWAAFLASVTLLAVGINLAPPAALVAVRSLMFSEVFADEATDEGRLNDLLGTQAVGVADPRRYRDLVGTQGFGQLSPFAKQHEGDGTGVAREILHLMSPGRPIGGCGAESLAEKVAMVADRRGCCSDYAAAFQVYAGAVGLPARRVETQTHTTNEYFDRVRGSWLWIDAMYRAQATDNNGLLLSFYQLRERLLKHQPVHIVELSNAPIAPETYHAIFDAKYYATAYWYPPTDVVAADEFDGRWRRFHVTRPVRQLVGYLMGVRAEPTGLGSAPAAHRLRITSRVAWVLLTVVATTLLLLAVALATRYLKLGWELLAQRATTAINDCTEESE